MYHQTSSLRLQGKEAALKRLDEVTKKWEPLYPHAINRWNDNWDVITPIFKFSMDVRTAFYTTNSIESLNSCFRRLNKQRSVFPSSQALMKALYLSTFEIIKKWTMPIRNWGRVYGELQIMYEGRLPESQTTRQTGGLNTAYKARFPS